MSTSRVLLGLALCLSSFAVRSADDPCIPAKPTNEDHLVFQYTDFLSTEEVERLDTKLVRFAQETSNRILVIIVGDLCGYPASDFAFEVGQKWGVGKKGLDNGIIFLIQPTGPPGKRDVFIATGYGLEGAIPDLACKQIVEKEVIPRFKNGDFYGGIDAGTDVLMGLAKGEFNAKSYGEEKVPWGPMLIIVFIIIFVIFNAVTRTRRYARTNNLDFWTAYTLLNAMRQKHRGTWGGFTGGRGGGWGGGGGFGGFGGGSFGGGGAGGSW